jgi:sulfide:quinone oxidoreductase
MPLRALSSSVWVSGQIALPVVAEAAAAGVRRIVSNRPDGEESGQPTAADMAAAAQAAGLEFVHAPVVGMPSAEAIAAVAAAIEDGEPVLLFCRSGMRSAATWALAMRSLGRGEPDTLRAAAAEAGYDLSRVPL